jgi:hypothetical protein
MKPNNEPWWVKYIRTFYKPDDVDFTTRFVTQTLDTYHSKIIREIETLGFTDGVPMAGNPNKAATTYIDMEAVAKVIDKTHRESRVDLLKLNVKSTPRQTA